MSKITKASVIKDLLAQQKSNKEIHQIVQEHYPDIKYSTAAWYLNYYRKQICKPKHFNSPDKIKTKTIKRISDNRGKLIADSILLTCCKCKKEYNITVNDLANYTEEVINNWVCHICDDKPLYPLS